MTTTDPKLIEPVAWLIERRVSPPQWSINSAPTGVGSFYSDIHRAHRFDTREAAESAMLRMCITAKERGEYFVSEHAWVTPLVPNVVEMDEDWLEEVISDSIDMDWRPRDAARLILSRLGEVTPLYTAAAINEAVAAERAGKWQDIATAPRDGTPILATLLVKNSATNLSWWEPNVIWACEDEGEWDRGWSFNDYTHWQPLPEAPQKDTRND